MNINPYIEYRTNLSFGYLFYLYYSILESSLLSSQSIKYSLKLIFNKKIDCYRKWKKNDTYICFDGIRQHVTTQHVTTCLEWRSDLHCSQAKKIIVAPVGCAPANVAPF